MLLEQCAALFVCASLNNSYVEEGLAAVYDLSGFVFKTLVRLQVVRILWLFVAQVK